ncbi:hypothetical protein P3T76_005450 [Phytophthora citrophthora]|uniref:Uncharacterized protein n=1 Tax=Phytophthora citrophthora TaxID=4793 RepID=A0AAD9GRB9_9STRA|nr:hypothetical protein P3T76_005450 [Phytophthora citrophthora]
MATDREHGCMLWVHVQYMSMDVVRGGTTLDFRHQQEDGDAVQPGSFSRIAAITRRFLGFSLSA